MQIGIFAKTFPGGDPTTVLRAVKAAGYDCCQYNMACSGLAPVPAVVSDDVVDALRAAAQETGVKLAALSATFNMIHPSTEEQRKGLNGLATLAMVAKACSIPIVTLCTGSRNAADQWAHHPDNRKSEAWADLLNAMTRAVILAEEHDIVLGVEPEHGNVVYDAAAARRLLDELKSPHVKIVFDPANLIANETGAEQDKIISLAWDLLHKDVVMVHAKDKDGNGRNVAAGTGIVDLKAATSKMPRQLPLITHGLDAVDAARVATHLRTL